MIGAEIHYNYNNKKISLETFSQQFFPADKWYKSIDFQSESNQL